MYWLKPSPSNFEEPHHVLNTCGKPWVCCGGGRGVLKERMNPNRGRKRVKAISMLTLWKIAWFFKQQIEVLLISCLAVAKSFMKKAYSFFKTFFIYQHVNIFIVVIKDIYLCKKCLFWVYKKIFFSPFSLLNVSLKNFISILHVKWIGMNMEKAGCKFEVLSQNTFWMTPKSFCCMKDLYFHLKSNTLPYQLNGFIPFSPMENIFPNSLINS